MKDYHESTYGDRIADIYDEFLTSARPALLDPTDCVNLLTELAGGGPVLELGVGTGRVAIPLADRGLEVDGIDSSQAMLDRLAEKDVHGAVNGILGNMLDVGVDRDFSLVYVVFTTFFALPTQADQVRCFQNVSERLTSGGRFVIEAFVPDLGRYRNGGTVNVSNVETDEVVLDVSRVDPVAQTIVGQHVLLSEAGARLVPLRLRYAWPSELDLMGRLAGLQLENRWSDWHRSPFTPNSGSHISVYRKP